jgi:hypothetical protein
MSYPDLRAFLADLGGDLLGVKQAFDPKHEMAAMLRAMPGNGPAVLFKNVSGHPGARVVGNLVASRRRVAKALDTIGSGTGCDLPAAHAPGHRPAPDRRRAGQGDMPPGAVRPRHPAAGADALRRRRRPLRHHRRRAVHRSGDRPPWHGHPSHDGQGRHAHGHPARQSALVGFPRQRRSRRERRWTSPWRSASNRRC